VKATQRAGRAGRPFDELSLPLAEGKTSAGVCRGREPQLTFEPDHGSLLNALREPVRNGLSRLIWGISRQFYHEISKT
jgi:hypothetical protein